MCFSNYQLKPPTFATFAHIHIAPAATKTPENHKTAKKIFFKDFFLTIFTPGWATKIEF